MLVNSLFSYGMGKTPSSWEFLNTRPAFTRVYYILGGTAYYQDSERELCFTPGMLYLLPADRPYSMWEDKENKLDHLFLHVLTTPKLSSPLVRDPREDAFLSDLLALLCRYVAARHTAAVRRLAEALVLFVTEDGERGGKLSRRLRAHLDEQFRTPFSAEALSRAFGYSPSRLYKAFREDFGVSPKRYHADRRFEYAARRLEEGASATALAEELSYSSLANFSRDFKKRFGLPPAEYVRWLPRR